MKLMCIGDSLTLGYPFEKDKSWTSIIAKATSWELLNFGVNGESSEEILKRVIEENYLKDQGRTFGSDKKVDKATILCGSNDFVFDTNNLLNVLANTLQIALLCKKENIEPVILAPILCSPDQAREAWVDGMGIAYEEVNSNLEQLRLKLMEACKDFDFGFIDLQQAYSGYGKYEDGLHPTEKGYEIIAEIIKEEMKNEKR